MEGKKHTALIIFVVFILLSVVLYLAEGIELALAELRDKDSTQLRNETTRVVLGEIQRRPDFFFSQRQIFVVAIISFISIISTTFVESFYLYGYGPVTKPIIVGIINFIFINIWILCFCQVAPKRLALANSEQFLAQSKILWPCIKLIGILNIPGPSEIVVWAAKRLFKLKERNLLPSRPAHYNISAKINGFCIDQMFIEVVIQNDGSADITREYLYIFLHGRRKAITGEARAGEPPARFINNIDIIGSWVMPEVEDLRAYESFLDEIFRVRRSKTKIGEILEGSRFEKLDLSGRMRWQVNDQDDLTKKDWEINFLDDIPEGVFSTSDRQRKIVCILYSASGRTAPGAFVTGNNVDFWTERASVACRMIAFNVVTAANTSFNVGIQGCEVGLEHASTRLAEEASRCDENLKNNGAIRFPILGAVYKVKWETMTTRRV